MANRLHQTLHHVRNVARHAGGAKQEDAAVAGGVVVGVDVVGKLAAALEGGEQGGVVARAQQVAEQVERRNLRLRLGRLVGARPDGQRRGRHGAEAVFHGAQHGVGVEVSYGHEDHVVGHVPGIEDAQHVVALDGPYGLFEADDRTAVRVGGEGQVEEALGDFVVRAVLAAAELLQHHLLFALQLGRVEKGVQNGVAQHVETGLPETAGQGNVVDRLVVIRPRVHRASGALDEGGDFAVREAVRALEQHVLENVRDAGHRRVLVGAAKPYPRLQGDNRRAVVL